MDNVLIAWTRLNDDESNQKFQKMLTSIVTSAKSTTYMADERHVAFVDNRTDLDIYVHQVTCDLLICDENLGGEHIGVKTLKSFKGTNPDMNVILVLEDDKRSKGKVMGMYNEGFYNGLFLSDLKPRPLAERIVYRRTKDEAFEYYGLDQYEDLFTKSKTAPKERNGGIDQPVKEQAGRKNPVQDKPAPAGYKGVEPDSDKTAARGGADADRKNAPQADNVGKGRAVSKAEDKASKQQASNKSDSGSASGADTGHADASKGKNRNRKGDDPVSAILPEPEDDGIYAEEPHGNSAAAGNKNNTDDTDTAPSANTGGSGTADGYDNGSESAGAGTDPFEAFAGTAPAVEEPEPAQPKKKRNRKKAEQTEPVDDSITAFESPVELTSTEAENAAARKEERDEDADILATQKIESLSAEDAAKMLLKEDIHDVIAYISEKSKEALKVVSVERQRSSSDSVLDSLLTFYTEKDNTYLRNLRDGIMSRDEFEEDLWRRIHTYDVTDLQAQDIYTKFGQFMWGYDILEPYINDKNVSDIKVVSPEHVQIKYKGKKKPVEVQFRDALHYRAFVSRLAHRNHVDIHNDDIAIFTDTTSFEDVRLRVNLTTEYINSSGYPTLHIRKINNIKYTTEQLIDAGMMGPRTAAYLINAAQNYSGIVFTGKGSAGKTTLMNWLIDYIPKDMSGLCIQESDELFTKTHPFIQFQRVTSNADGKKAYNLKDLSINGLLTDIDYFIIGESKGAECKYFTNAAYTGNRCWTSVHSPNSHGALPKIADYAKYESDYTKDDILQMLTSLQCVVFLKNFKVSQISEVCGWDAVKREIIYKDIPLDDPSDYKTVTV